MTKPKDQPSKEDLALEIITKWQFHWMMNEPGYEARASAIDANMRYDLATAISESCESQIKALQEENEKLRDEIRLTALPALKMAYDLAFTGLTDFEKYNLSCDADIHKRLKSVIDKLTQSDPRGDGE